MSHPSVAVLILRILRIGVLFCAGSATLVLAIVLWEQMLSNHEMSITDYAFLAVVVGVIAAAMALSRSINREIGRAKTLTSDDAD
jgi:hypothetical protein